MKHFINPVTERFEITTHGLSSPIVAPTRTPLIEEITYEQGMEILAEINVHLNSEHGNSNEQ